MASPTAEHKLAPQQESTSGVPIVKKLANLVGHYIDFSDSSSIGSFAASDSGFVSSDKNELSKPLLGDATDKHGPAATEGPDTPAQSSADSVSSSPSSGYEPQQIAAETPQLRTSDLESQSSGSVDAIPESSDSADEPSIDLAQSPASQQSVTRRSSDGARTPTQQDVRTLQLQSQPVEEEVVPVVTSNGSLPKQHSGDLQRLGSGILDPSLLQPLLSDDPLPEPSHQGHLYVPHEPDAHHTGTSCSTEHAMWTVLEIEPANAGSTFPASFLGMPD